MLTKLFKISIVAVCLLALAMPVSAQSAPSEAAIPPFPGAPLCADKNGDGHSDVTDNSGYGTKPDNILWHDLWNEVDGCHYDHTHNDNPALGDSIFGAAGAAWGQAISYPWMTANENSGMGHGGYKYYVNLNPQPACAFEGYEYLGVSSLNCVSAFRIEYHDAGGNAHMAKRFHSYFMEVQVKRGNTVGYIKTGGWADFGCLHASYKSTFIPLPGIDPVQANGQTQCGTGGQSIHSDPYRAFSNTWAETQGQTSGDNWSIWTAHDRYGYNRVGFFFFRTMDNWGAIDQADPYTEHLLCPDAQCKYNNSEHHVFNVFMMVPASLDTDRDGIVNYKGYTDKQGNITQGCTAASADCVPLEIVNAPVGNAIWSRNLSGIRTDGDAPHDSDIYFNGQPSGWIKFMNMSTMPTSTPATPATPMPSNTPNPAGPFVSIEADQTNLSLGGSATISVKLNNVPVEGYQSAEFACTYDASLIEKSNLAAGSVFGADPVLALPDSQNGAFIVAIAGANGNKATASGPAFTFSVKGLQAGQAPIQCAARVSKGDNIPLPLPASNVNLTVLGTEPSPTMPPHDSPTATPGDYGHEHPTATEPPLGSSTPLPPTDGALTGQILAGKPVTVTLYDANNVVVQSLMTNPDGTFLLTAPAGAYTLTITADGFLGYQGAVTFTAGNTVVKSAINLPAGDIDGNNVIDQFDALTVGMSYNTAFPSAADLNNDAVIDFLDLELLAENYRKAGPLVWE